MVTHAVHILPDVDKILVLREGKIAETGSYDELIARPDSVLAGLVKTHVDETSSRVKDSPSMIVGSATEEFESAAEQEVQMTAHSKSDEHAANDLTGEEKSNHGRVKPAVYLEYSRAASFCAMGAVAFLFLTNPLTQAATTFWLALWADDAYDQTQWFYLSVYAAVSFAALGLMVLRQLMRAVASVRASKSIHAQLLEGVMNAPLSFFQTTPVGRCLNRFSSDQSTVDEDLFGE